jgi:hypothetical protein
MAEKKKEQKGKAERPLEDRTIKELREEALKTEGIHGVHGMNKEELLTEIRKARGIPEPEKKKDANIRSIKQKIAEFKKKKEEEREQGATRNRLEILRRKISKLRKQTRRLAS